MLPVILDMMTPRYIEAVAWNYTHYRDYKRDGECTVRYWPTSHRFPMLQFLVALATAHSHWARSYRHGTKN